MSLRDRRYTLAIVEMRSTRNWRSPIMFNDEKVDERVERQQTSSRNLEDTYTYCQNLDYVLMTAFRGDVFGTCQRLQCRKCPLTEPSVIGEFMPALAIQPAELLPMPTGHTNDNARQISPSILSCYCYAMPKHDHIYVANLLQLTHLLGPGPMQVAIAIGRFL